MAKSKFKYVAKVNTVAKTSGKKYTRYYYGEGPGSKTKKSTARARVSIKKKKKKK